MIIMFIIGIIIDRIQQHKWEKERAKFVKPDPIVDMSKGYKVRMDIPYRGKYNDIY